MISGYSKNKILSLRYENGTNNLFSNDELIRIYSDILSQDGYDIKKAKDTVVCRKDEVIIRLQNRFGFILVIVEGVK